MPRILVPIAPGSEELEAVTIIDILRRAQFDVTVASLDGEPTVMSRKTVIVPDTSLDEALRGDYDMVVLPGGLPGADNLDKDKRIHDLLKKMAGSGKFVGAVCAAPFVLANAGVLKGKRATSFPGFLDQMDLDDVEVTGGAVECDGKIITSRGPGTAMDFALQIVESLAGKEKRDEVETRLVRDETSAAKI